MPLTLPQLDDRAWKDLVEEARALIPSLAPDWTNFNASDPGITLVELFAYLTETLLYRVNRVSEPSQRAFLKLINGPAWQDHGDLGRNIRNTLAGLRHCLRAVTAHDFESLAMGVNDQTEFKEKVARAHCLPRRNLEAGGAPQLDMPGHVTVLILPTTRSRPSEHLLRRVRAILEPARLITTRVHVVAPRFVLMNIRVTLVIQKDALPKTVRASGVAALEKFLDPLEGGPDGFGWPFGRDVYISEIYRILARLPGVQYATRTVDSETQRSLDEFVLDSADNSRLIRNRLGELEAVDLQPDELVKASLDAATIEVKYQNQ
jgi:Baseplate J-like protein